MGRAGDGGPEVRPSGADLRQDDMQSRGHMIDEAVV
jgi:hypothetical protein